MTREKNRDEARPRAGTTRYVVLSGALAVATLAPTAARADARVHISCPKRDAETLAAFEARARAELLVRGASGRLWLDCSIPTRLRWTPDNGVPRQLLVDESSADDLMIAVERLLEFTPDDPSLPASDGPHPGGELHALSKLRQWKGTWAAGAQLGVAWRRHAFHPGASLGFLSSLAPQRGLSVSVVQLGADVQMELGQVWLVGVGTTLSRSFSSSPAAVEQQDPDPWFLETRASALSRIAIGARGHLVAGAELSWLPNPIEFQVDDRVAISLPRWQVGANVGFALDLW